MNISARKKPARCLRCGIEFMPRKVGHIYCSSGCRHRGVRRPDQPPIDHDQIDRLFDESRNPGEQVRAEDWHPSAHFPEGRKLVELDRFQTLASRRRWYLNLIALDV